MPSLRYTPTYTARPGDMYVHATYTTTVQPTQEPVTLGRLKQSLRLFTCDFDEELRQLLIAGRRQVEDIAKRSLLTQTVVLNLDRFPTTYKGTIEFRLPPLQSVTSIEYIDNNDKMMKTVPVAEYDVDTTATPPRITRKFEDDWPITYRKPNAVTITCQAGYTGLDTLPIEATLAVIEWCKMNWKGCEGSEAMFDRLMSSLEWTALGRAQ